MNAPAEKLAEDVRVLASDVQELVKATAAESGEKISAARARVQVALADARETVVLRGRSAAHATDRYVHENAWTSVGLAAVAGVVLGILIGRK